MKYFTIIVLGLALAISSCKNNKSENTAENVNEPAPAPTIDYDAEFANVSRSNVPVYHALVGVTNPYGGARMNYLRDFVVAQLQYKFLYIDKDSELHLVEKADSVQLNELHPKVQYLMKTHVYDGEAPTGFKMQLVNVSFTNSEATNVSRSEIADRPDWYDWDKKIKLSNFPKDCRTADVECKATNLVNNIVKMAFL